LNVINTYKQEFDVLVGYSDHSVGIGAAPYAVCMGAKVIEKHFTLDKNADGPDHRASLNPKELICFVDMIRKVEEYLGSYFKSPTKSEVLTRKMLQKCLVVDREIKMGETFSEDNVVAKRTGGKGLSPICYRKIIGKKTTRNYKQNEILDIT